MDLRNVRNAFYDRKLAYACSFDPATFFNLREATAGPRGIRVSMKLPKGSPSTIGDVFHVLDAASVAGADGRKHNCPVGEIKDVDESIVFRPDTPVGEIEGRMYMTTSDGATIEVTYNGIVRYPAPARAVFEANDQEAQKAQKDDEAHADPVPLEGRAWLVTSFVTGDSRYRWLAEHSCVAFGTWVAKADVNAKKDKHERIIHDIYKVQTRLDVYSAG